MVFAVRMEGITKRFGALVASDSVDFEVEQGTIHALVGENGAGKTTLMRVLYGLYRADSGRITVEGKVRNFRTPQDALAAGIGMVSQHYSVIPELTCIDNLMLGAEPATILDRNTATRRAIELAARIGFTFDWQAEASTLGPAGCQKLEILKLLWRDARVMILDEPTAMLSPEDGEALFQNLRRLVAEGRTVILVTHRLSEVMDHCSSVTVMRDGRVVANARVSNTNASQLAEHIVGQEVKATPVTPPEPAPPGLEVRELAVKGERGNDAVAGASFSISKGEVVGIAGVDGSGQRELIQALCGLRGYDGKVVLDGNGLSSKVTAADRIQMGLRLIPEDRREEALILDWSVQDNAMLGLQRVEYPQPEALAAAVLGRFDTKSTGPRAPMASLSGGNQQRFVAGRALFGAPKALIAVQPTRGLDIRGTEDVYSAIRAECRRGMAALVISFDLDEILQYCDRLLVMYSGRVSEPPNHLAKDRAAIGRMMVGLEP